MPEKSAADIGLPSLPARNGLSVPSVANGANAVGTGADEETVEAAILLEGLQTGLPVVATDDGYFPTYVRMNGWDNRTHDGYFGTIQLVSPLMTQWVGPSSNYFTGGIGVMRLQFAPEPHEWLMLGAGVSLLGVLYRVKRRSLDG